MELNIVFSKKYTEVRDLCQEMKRGDISVINPFLDEIAEALPTKSLLVPMPQSSGKAEYTEKLAIAIAEHCNNLGTDKTAVVLDCLCGYVHDSVCGRKAKGEPFDDIDFGFVYRDGADSRVKALADKGWEVILVDNGDSVQGDVIGTLSKGEAIVDTGTTASAAIAALNINKVSILELGDTGAWKHF